MLERNEPSLCEYGIQTTSQIAKLGSEFINFDKIVQNSNFNSQFGFSMKKIIQISTNMPSIGSVLFKITCLF